MSTEYDLKAVRGRAFYAENQALALEGILDWMTACCEKGISLSLHVVKFQDSEDDNEPEVATVFYEETP